MSKTEECEWREWGSVEWINVEKKVGLSCWVLTQYMAGSQAYQEELVCRRESQIMWPRAQIQSRLTKVLNETVAFPATFESKE